MKTCNQCKKEKPLTAFHRRGINSTKHRAICKCCAYSNELATGMTPERREYLNMKAREYRARKR